MKIVSISATAGRTFNHPYERYANFRLEFSLTGTLDPEDQTPEGAEFASYNLRRCVEEAAENHKRSVLADLAQEQQREKLEQELKEARRWPERVDRFHATLTKLQSYYLPLLDKWETLTGQEHERIADGILLHGYWEGGTDQLRRHVEQRSEALQKNIDEETAGGPSRIASLMARLKDLPPLRVLPPPEPDIHPGNPDHPATDFDNEDYPPCQH